LGNSLIREIDKSRFPRGILGQFGEIFFPLITWFEKIFHHFQASVVQQFGSKRGSNPRPCGHEAAALSLHHRGLKMEKIVKTSMEVAGDRHNLLSYYYLDTSLR
jgi:hypothetical protein